MPLVATRPSVRAGRYGRRIDIQQATAVTDANSASDDDTDAGITWTTLFSSWASIQPNVTSGGMEGREAEQGEMQWLVQMRYQPGILDGMRVREPFYSSVGATTFTATTATDPSASWTVNALAGFWVSAGSSEGFVLSNTATKATVSFWVGNTPAPGTAFAVARNILDILAAVNVYSQQLVTELHCLSHRYPPV